VSYPRRAATIITSKALLESSTGPNIPEYNIPLDTPRLYRWAVGSTATDDNLTVLSASGGTAGRHILVRDSIKGDDLTNADETLTVAGNFFRMLPATTTLTASRTKTLSTTNAAAGDIIHITRLGLGAFTMLIVNGGAGAGTLFTLPSGAAWWAKAYFDGTNWLAHSAGAMP